MIVPPFPLIMLHTPVPVAIPKGLANKLAEVIPQSAWSAPASEIVGTAFTVTELASTTPVPAPLLNVNAVSLYTPVTGVGSV